MIEKEIKVKHIRCEWSCSKCNSPLHTMTPRSAWIGGYKYKCHNCDFVEKTSIRYPYYIIKENND